MIGRERQLRRDPAVGFCDGLKRLEAAAEQRELRAGGAQMLGCGGADARPSPGDQRVAAGKWSFSHASPLSLQPLAQANCSGKAAA